MSLVVDDVEVSVDVVADGFGLVPNKGAGTEYVVAEADGDDVLDEEAAAKPEGEGGGGGVGVDFDVVVEEGLIVAGEVPFGVGKGE